MKADQLRAGRVWQPAGALMRRLRASRIVALLSALLLLVQVVATAEHLSSAAFAAGLGPSGAGQGGFLDFCRSPRPGDVAGADTSLPASPDVCPACAIAAAAAGGVVSLTPALVAPVSHPLDRPPLAVADLADPRPCLPYGATRGPPLA